MNARRFDADWRSACCELPGGESPHWFDGGGTDDDAEDQGVDVPTLTEGDGLCARGVGMRVGTSALLHGVDLQLARGEVGAILGPNGAGKSTLLSVLAGLRAPDTGSITLNRRAVSPSHVHQLARHRAVLPQETAVAFDFRVQEVVQLGRYPHHLQPSRHEAAIVQAAMQTTGVADMAQRTVASLSGGERARAQLARVMAQIWEPSADGAPRWLLLDEPTAALDLHHQHDTLSTVQRWAREQDVGVLAVLHDPNLALRYADRVWVLDGGAMRASGHPARVLRPALVEQVWQVRASAARAADGVPQLLIAAGAPRISGEEHNT